jgi:hypothetical protein
MKNKRLTAILPVVFIDLLEWAWASSVFALILVLTPIGIARGVLNTLLTSALTKAVHRDEVGGILGPGASINSPRHISSPIIGGALIEQLGPSGPGLFGAATLAGLSTFVWNEIFNHPIAADIARQAGENA